MILATLAPVEPWIGRVQPELVQHFFRQSREFVDTWQASTAWAWTSMLCQQGYSFSTIAYSSTPRPSQAHVAGKSFSQWKSHAEFGTLAFVLSAGQTVRVGYRNPQLSGSEDKCRPLQGSDFTSDRFRYTPPHSYRLYFPASFTKIANYPRLENTASWKAIWHATSYLTKRHQYQ